jgi:hypothetical protein
VSRPLPSRPRERCRYVVAVDGGRCVCGSPSLAPQPFNPVANIFDLPGRYGTALADADESAARVERGPSFGRFGDVTREAGANENDFAQGEKTRIFELRFGGGRAMSRGQILIRLYPADVATVGGFFRGHLIKQRSTRAMLTLPPRPLVARWRGPELRRFHPRATR